MNESKNNEVFGDFSQYEKARNDLFETSLLVFKFPSQREHERHFLLAAVRRTLSLESAFRQAVDSRNGQMAMTLIRLNLDTLARLYALYWAEDTKGMTAETLARDVAQGKSIKNMKFRGSKEKASDRWLILQIEGLGKWIPEVYKKTSGAIHFSDFHITQLLQQAKPVKMLDDGSLHAELFLGPGERDGTPELYRELQQAFLHISMMLIEALKHRCELAT